MMKKTTKKELKKLVAYGFANQIATFNQAKEIAKTEKSFTQLEYSCGLYGCTGKLIQGDTTKNHYILLDSAIYYL